MLFQPIDQPLHPLALAGDGAVEGAFPTCILLLWNGEAAPVASQVLADRAAALALIAHHTVGTPCRATIPVPLDGPTLHEGLEGDGLVSLARGQHQGREFPTAFCSDRDLGAAPP